MGWVWLNYMKGTFYPIGVGSAQATVMVLIGIEQRNRRAARAFAHWHIQASMTAKFSTFRGSADRLLKCLCRGCANALQKLCKCKTITQRSFDLSREVTSGS
jgi:hypothetical protein